MAKKRFISPFNSKDRFETKEQLEKFITNNHKNDIPSEFTLREFLFRHRNLKNEKVGLCGICSKPTPWNEARGKYQKICSDSKCIEKTREQYLENMKKKHGKEHLMDDPEHQIKMMKARGIAIDYTWRDGKEYTVLGNIEAKTMEVLDKKLKRPSSSIYAPGHIIEYTDEKGLRHTHHPDIYDAEYNLIISCKDGLENPNKHPNFKKDRLKNLLIYQSILNNYDYNYVQIEGHEGVKGIENVYKSLKSIGSKSRYILPPRVDFFMYSESVNVLTNVVIDKNLHNVNENVREIIFVRDKNKQGIVHTFIADDIFNKTTGRIYIDGSIISSDYGELLNNDNYFFDIIVLSNDLIMDKTLKDLIDFNLSNKTQDFNTIRTIASALKIEYDTIDEFYNEILNHSDLSISRFKIDYIEFKKDMLNIASMLGIVDKNDIEKTAEIIDDNVPKEEDGEEENEESSI